MTSPAQINFGCGVHAPERWLNLDGSLRVLLEKIPFFSALGGKRHFPRHVRFGRVGRQLSFADDSVALIYSSHMIEHLSKNEMEVFLGECFRILRPSGRIRLMTPSLRLSIEAYSRKRTDPSKKDAAADEFMRDLGMTPENTPGGLHHALIETLRRKNWHQWLYDERSLEQRFLGAGFAEVTVKENWVSDFPDLELLEPTSLRAGSICAEASKA